MSALRVVSLLPSATEALCEIGGAHLLVGRSHECDWPPSIQHVPVLTAQKTTFTTPRDIDEQVRNALANNESLYTVNADLLQELKPDVILTQSLCSVCSIDMNEVVKLARQITPRPKVISLNPYTLGEVLESLEVVGEAVQRPDEAKEARMRLQDRVDIARKRADGSTPRFKNIAFVEWPDPIYVGGHWTPEIIRMAGARQGVNDNPGSKSFAIETSRLQDDDPDAIIVCPCGLDLPKTEELTKEMEASDWWPTLRAVQENNVALVDGNQMFNRPGPRLVDCLEWLVDWLHPLDPKAPGSAKPDFPFKPYVRDPDAGSAAAKAKLKEEEEKRLQDIEDLHKAAMAMGEKMYADPATGYMVFTAQAALDRGFCCGRGCRHCPYGHWKVPAEQRKHHHADPITDPRLLRAERVPRKLKAVAPEPDATLRIVFWSGGKDSFLTFVKTCRSAKRGDKIVLLNTFDPISNIVPEQDIALSDIMEQAKALHMDMLIVPLPRASPNQTYVDTVEQSLQILLREYNFPKEQVHLVFGDLHLEDIRAWRANNFASWHTDFPLFNIPYEELEKTLWDALDTYQADVIVSASNVENVPGVAVGTPYSPELVKQLTESAASSTSAPDPFGESGEFHTHVRFAAE